MGKRNSVVILSSDDDEDSHKFSWFRSKSNPTNSNSKSKSKLKSKSKSKSSASRSSSRASKKSRTSDSCDLFDAFKNISEDFAEDFAGFKVSADLKTVGLESWVDKYRPCTLEELGVHRKKVEEVKAWFQERLGTSKTVLGDRVLIITGPAGVGKSATVHVVASQFGAQVCEWNTPTPTLWQEHIHNSSSGTRYVSKLDEFESFVERARKYGLLSSSIFGSTSPTVLLIDDLPVVNGRPARVRLLRCLQLLVKSVCMPTVILVTDYGRADSANASMHSLDELLSSLESAGACKVAFNPITENSIKKSLSRICRLEQCTAACDQIDLIAKSSEGDIRHAITSLQYICLKPQPIASRLPMTCGSDRFDEKASCLYSLDDVRSLSFGRDQTLSLFHALGKFLHNKREVENSVSSCEDPFPLKEGFTRLPLKMDAPEKVLCQAYGQARPIAEFLHENVLDFLHEEAIDDAWAVMSHFSDADCLLSSLHRGLARNYEAENIAQSVAASVAVRGVLFGNAHPSSSRWHTIRRPTLWHVERSAWGNKCLMEKQRCSSYNGLSVSDISLFSTEYRPVSKWLAVGDSVSSAYPSSQSNFIEGSEPDSDDFDPSGSRKQENETTDDDIEDW